MQSGGRPLRVFYAFDPARDAVLLLDGDRTGDGRFYERMKRPVETIWNPYKGGRPVGAHDFGVALPSSYFGALDSQAVRARRRRLDRRAALAAPGGGAGGAAGALRRPTTAPKDA